MPHYMIKGSYNAEGAKALMAEGGTARLEQAKALIESLGGTLESMYFVWGTDDIVGFSKCLTTLLRLQPQWLYLHPVPYQLASYLYSHQGISMLQRKR